MDEQEELVELLSRLPANGRAFLWQYFRSAPEIRTEMRADLEAGGKPGWAEMLADIDGDAQAERTFAGVLETLEQRSPSQIREIRILADWRGQLLQVVKIAFTRNDFSVYLIPHAAHGRYFYGAGSFEEQEIEQTFDFTEQLSAEHVPKLSLHESGQVHVRADGERAGPLRIPPLGSLRGQHVASISVDTFAGLPHFEGMPRSSSSAVDHVIPAEAEAQSGRLAIFVNGKEPAFDGPARLTVTLTRLGRTRPLFVGIATRAQLPLGTPEQAAGVTVIGGWVPGRSSAEANDYLYLRGQ